MKPFIVMLAAVLLFSCSEEDATRYSIDAELAPYVDSFYAEAAKYGKSFPKENLIVILKKGIPVTARTIRQVNSRDGNQVTIEMNEEYFRANQTGGISPCIESVMFHEMGHAKLRREHTNTYSIMNTITGESCYMNEHPNAREVLIEELFTKSL